MKKIVLISLCLLVVVVTVGLALVLPHLRMAANERSLFAAPNIKVAADVARKILKSNSARGRAAIRQYADQHRLCAFDTTHDLLLLCDENNGEVYVVYAGLQGATVSTGDRSLDKAVAAAIPEITSESFSIGKPPKLFEGMHLLTPKEDQADFVLKHKAANEWSRVSFEFDKGRLLSQGLHDVTDTEVDTWRGKQDWPETWK
jgi:hypothetical protein